MFQDLMDIVLHPQHIFMATYLDDTVNHSSTWADHLYHLRAELQELRKAGLTTNPHKCHLGLTEVEYPVYCIGHELLKPQEKKVEPV